MRNTGDAVGLESLRASVRYEEASRILKLLREGCKWP
jgi:hypothetical protein